MTKTVIYPNVNYLNKKDHVIEDAGFKIGEIVAYRAWAYRDGTIRSVVYDNYLWLPGGIQFDPEKSVYEGFGFHAFKDMHDALEQFHHLYTLVIFGEVYLWGEVIEHENGYRAQYAKIKKITSSNSGSPYYDEFGYGAPMAQRDEIDLDEIRKMYGLEEK